MAHSLLKVKLQVKSCFIFFFPTCLFLRSWKHGYLLNFLNLVVQGPAYPFHPVSFNEWKNEFTWVFLFFQPSVCIFFLQALKGWSLGIAHCKVQMESPLHPQSSTRGPTIEGDSKPWQRNYHPGWGHVLGNKTGGMGSTDVGASRVMQGHSRSTKHNHRRAGPELQQATCRTCRGRSSCTDSFNKSQVSISHVPGIPAEVGDTTKNKTDSRDPVPMELIF